MYRLFALLLIAVAVHVQTVAAFTQRAPQSLALVRPSESHSALHAATLSSITAASVGAIPNPFKQLPWNVKKEQERQARRMKLERAQLHRQLGIPEDATYEEIVVATDTLIARAGTDIKQKIKVEVAKDKILQIRLNERLAGLIEVDKDARAQSRAEDRFDEEDDSPKQAKEWNAPQWTQGLVVKPDADRIRSQIRIWGIITMIGAALPPAQDYLGRFTWLVCTAQLTFRGMPQEMQDRGGMGMGFNMSGGKGGHRKVAFALGMATWVFGAILVYSLIPAWAKGQRWTATLGFAMQNFVFGVACSYLHPYKG